MARARATDEQSLIRAAAKVFRSKGYSNATIDDIADAAGVSRPTVYSYAKSKRWLLDRIVGEVLDDVGERMDANLRVDGDPLERLRAAINTYVEAAVVNGAFFPVVASEATELSPAVRKRQREWEKRIQVEFRTLLAECMPRERLEAGLDITVAANLLITMLTSLYRWYDPRGPVSPEELTDQVLMVVGGMLDGDSRASAQSQDDVPVPSK